MLFAYLSDSDSLNVTSVYEILPTGWFLHQAREETRGCSLGKGPAQQAPRRADYPVSKR